MIRSSILLLLILLLSAKKRRGHIVNDINYNIMGLNTTHGAYDGSYSGFMTWRKWIAEQDGFNLSDQIGFGGNEHWEKCSHDLHPLLNHSDCDGELTPDECERIVRGLEYILANVKETVENEYLIDKTKTFIKGCKSAIEANENIIFS